MRFEPSDKKQGDSVGVRAGRHCVRWTAASYTSTLKIAEWILPRPASAFELLAARNST